MQKRAEFNAKLENLKKQYRDKHPEIIQTQTEISKINDELEKLAKNTDQRVKQANQVGSRKAELQKKSLEIERDKADSQIMQIDQQITAKDDELRQNSGQIASLESKINSIPNVKVALESVSNQYQSAKTAYDELLKKYNNAQQQVQVESNAQGETIRIVDPANLPQTPENASKKPLVIALGGVIGLGLGLLLAAVSEFGRLFKIQNIDDAKHYTGLPVLASVPPLLTDHEIAWQLRLRLLKIAIGIVVAAVSVPIMIAVLEMSRVLERIT